MKSDTSIPLDNDDENKTGTSLRQRAEKQIGEKQNGLHIPEKKEDMQKLIHELLVYQLELKIQNEELIQRRSEVEVGLKRYTELFDFAPAGYFMLDNYGRIRQVNLIGATLLDKERSLLIDRRFYDFISTDSRPIFNKFLHMVFEQPDEKSGSVELTVLGNPPVIVQMEAQITGSNQECFMMVVDITDRKRVEDEIALKNIILLTQQETSPDGILVVDETAKIISYNQRFIDIWDIPKDIIALCDDELAIQSVLGKLQNPDEFLTRVNYLYEHPDEKSREEIFLVDGRVLDRFSAPMYGKDGRYFGRVWYFRDITNQKQAEQEILTLNQDLERRVEERTTELQQINEKLCATNEELTATEQELRVQVEVTNEAYDALEKSEERSRCLYESDLIGIAFAGMEKIEDSNDTFLAMVGYSRGDLKRGLISWQNLFPPEWAVADAKGFDELQSHGSCTPYEKEFYRKDGSRVSILFGSALLEKNPITSVNFILDISDRKKMSEQIKSSLVEKTTLLREIHHRVKNNLQIIISLLNLQIRRMDDPVTIETLKDCQNRVRSMALVHEHLYKGKDISHIDLGNYLKALGTGLFQSYEDGRRGIRFEINIRDIYVDINIAIPLGLISNELIINSLKYAFSEKTGGILSLTATEDPETLNFIVADNGGGIPEGITLENQDSMGLRLVNMFTDQLNATVVIDRTEGTKFSFAIPKPRE